MIARLHTAGDLAGLRRTVRQAAVVIFLFSLPVAVGTVVFSRQLMGIFGGDFEGNSTSIAILAVGQLIFAATGLAGIVLVMTNRETFLLRSALYSAISNVLLNGILIPPFGIAGAATSGTISLAVLSLAAGYYARRRAGVPSTAIGL